MKKKLAIVATVIIILGIIALIVVKYKYFTNGHNDPLKSEDKIYITAPQLYALYSQFEDSANHKYNDSVISVTGAIQSVELNGDRYTVALNSNDSNGAVLCEMDMLENEKIKKLKSGQQINLVGYCNGILIDVQLDRCKLAE
jgi:hypothetical protein